MSAQRTLVHGALYRVLTTQGRVFDETRWDREALRFVYGTGRTTRAGMVRSLGLDAVEAIAVRPQHGHCGGERFVPTADWNVETLDGAA